MWRGTLLDLLLTATKGWLRTELWGDHEIANFRSLWGWNRAKIRTIDPGFRGVDKGLFRDLLRRIPCDMVMKRRAVRENLLILKDHPLQAQEMSILTHK